jgi:hypothetical protein
MTDKQKVKCDICWKLFSSPKLLQQHKETLHATESKVVKSARKPFQFSNLRLVIIVFIALIAIGTSAGIYLATAQKPYLTTPLTIDGIECNAAEQLLFHIHAHLDIIINGQYFLVPAQIGIIPDKCFYWLHTHDIIGIIHIESPVNRDFTLGQFFDIWNKKFTNDQIKFNNNQIFNYVANGNNPLSVYINGTKVPNEANYREIKLHAHDEIAIVYGNAPSAIPSRYDFPQGF